MEEPVSSLYGPGAIICWLCTALSVLLSWSFNHSSRKWDVLTSDVLACLLLPAIAFTNLVYDLAHATKKEDWKATPTMDATFTICMEFAQFGPMLCYMAFSYRHKRRFCLTIVITMACWAIVLVGFTGNHSNVPRFDDRNAALPLIMSGLFIFFFVFYLMVEVSQTKFNVSPSRQSVVLCIFLPPVLLVLQLLSLLSYFCREDHCKADEDDNDQFQFEGRLLPQTPYSIGDFDQAVALSIGIITLLLSIRDIIQDYNFVIDDEFEYWRARCVRSIESGDTKMEVVRWKQELEVIDKMARCARTRIRHRRREHEAFKKLPKPVKLAINHYIQDSNVLILCGRSAKCIQ
jgi:hypothetical protein